MSPPRPAEVLNNLPGLPYESDITPYTQVYWEDAQRFIKYSPAPGEILFQCPYETSHILLEERMGRHMLKCRRRHEKLLEAKGDALKLLRCKWSEYHLIPEVEWPYHNYYCSEKNNASANGEEDVKKYAPRRRPAYPELQGAEVWTDSDFVGTYDPIANKLEDGSIIIQQPAGLTKGEKKKKLRELKRHLYGPPATKPDDDDTDAAMSCKKSKVGKRKKKRLYKKEKQTCEEKGAPPMPTIPEEDETGEDISPAQTLSPHQTEANTKFTLTQPRLKVEEPLGNILCLDFSRLSLY